MESLKSYSDDRGVIHTVIENEIIDSVLFITSNPGSKRANHYHKASGHWCTVVKGSIHYYERPVGDKNHPVMKIIKQGDTFWTGPMVEHLMSFPEYTEFWCFSTGSRGQERYEDDLVRLDFNLDEM